MCFIKKHICECKCVFFCIKTMKRYFLRFVIRDSNPCDVNEVVRCTMKSSLGSDEIKSAHLLPQGRFHRKAISSTIGGFIPQKADLIEKRQVETCRFSGRGYRNRTYTKGVRVPCATTTPIPTDESIIIQRHKKHKFSTQTANMKNYCNITLIVLKYKKILYIIWQKPLRIA